jgi:hypothetical protein
MLRGGLHQDRTFTGDELGVSTVVRPSLATRGRVGEPLGVDDGQTLARHLKLEPGHHRGSGWAQEHYWRRTGSKLGPHLARSQVRTSYRRRALGRN